MRKAIVPLSLLGGVTNLVWYLWPQFVPASSEVFHYAGYGASAWALNPVVYPFFAALSVLAFVAVALSPSKGRWLLACLVGASIALGPFMGLMVAGPLEATVGYIGAILSGAVLVAAFQDSEHQKEHE